MPDPDFSGLRTAVEDAVERVPYSSLRDRAAARRRRRAGLVAAGVVAVTALAVLAVPWIGPAPEPGLVPSPLPPTSPPGPPPGQVIETAFGRASAYALLGSCTPSGTDCRYELLASGDAGRSWTRLRSPVPPPAAGDGFSAELRLTGDDHPAVVDRGRGRVYASTDGGRTFTARALRGGPVLDAVPPGLRAETTACGGDRCRPARVVVLDPATGLESALRTQPPTASTYVDLATGEDGRIWVAGRDGTRLVSAVSSDRGRSWQPLTAPAAPPVRLHRPVPLPGPGAGAYLLTGREDDQRVLNAFSDLWRLDGTRWTRVTPPGAPPSALTAVGLTDGEVLLTAEAGGTWRTSGRGTRIARDPDPPVGDAGPLTLLQRSGPLLVGRRDSGELLVSTDDGRSWDLRPVLAR